jgi:sigma-B regulation protein RsbU (phosphoserine phosphatase)
MKILISEDDRVSRRLLESTLSKWGHETVVTCDGNEAWAALQEKDPPKLAILDWMMPKMDGLEVCRRIRQSQSTVPTYILLLTAKDRKADIVEGLIAGANDYVTKPFDRGELQARVQVGAMVVGLQQSLADRVIEVEEALEHVKLLQGILPICSYCRHVRDSQNYWQSVECYISEHSEAQFSHSICPDCYEEVVKPQMEELRQARRGSMLETVLSDQSHDLAEATKS